MVRIRLLLLAALVVAVGLLPANRASAGPILDWLCGDCERPSYSPFRYWAPAAAKLNDDLHGPRLSAYAPDRHPEIPITFTVLTYPCPSVPPVATLIETPTPPPTSKAR